MPADRPRITAAMWWENLGATWDNVCREFIRRALRAEVQDKGHECGHQFEITVRSTLHASGPGEHTDANWSTVTKPVTVRAHNLRDALLVAATQPLGSWLPQDESEESDG